MHSLRLRLLPTLAALLFAASAAAQTSFDARGLADDAAAVIEREYFDPARAREVDAVLRVWAGGHVPIFYLRGAICRRALEIEIEGHCAPA